MTFPDAENVVMTLLDPLGSTVTSLPRQVVPPVIVVNRVGGTDDGITDRPLVQVSCYGTDRPAAWSLSGQCQQAILNASGQAVGGILVDSTGTAAGGQQVPDLNPDDRRVISTYRLAIRRQPST